MNPVPGVVPGNIADKGFEGIPDGVMYWSAEFGEAAGAGSGCKDCFWGPID